MLLSYTIWRILINKIHNTSECVEDIICTKKKKDDKATITALTYSPNCTQVKKFHSNMGFSSNKEMDVK